MIRRKASVVTQKPAGTRTPSIRDSPPRCAPLPPTTATCISSTSCRPNTYCSIIAIPPRQPCSVALHWPVESPASRALSNLLLGTSSSLVAFPLRSRPAAPPSRAARTPAPPVPPAVRRHRVPHTSTTTHARRAPMSSSVLGPADDSAARPGSCRKPPSPLYVKSGKERDLLALPFGRPLRTDTLLVKRRRAAYGGTRRWPRRMSHRPTGAAAAREVLLFAGKARTPSSAPPFSRTSSRNASAGPSSPNGRPPSFTAALAQIGRHPSERPHATPPGSPRSWPGCPAAPTRSPSRAPPAPASIDARQRRWNTTQPAHDGSALNSA